MSLQGMVPGVVRVTVVGLRIEVADAERRAELERVMELQAGVVEGPRPIGSHRSPGGGGIHRFWK
jgi:hypothetical protein